MEEKDNLDIDTVIPDTHQDTTSEGLSNDDAIKSIIRVLKEFYGILKSHFIVFVIPIILIGLFAVYKTKQSKPTFTAKITFFLSEERPQVFGSGVNSFSTLLQSTNDNFGNPKKLKEYSFTEKVGSKMLFRKYVFRGREDYLANHYLRLFSGYNRSYFKEFTSVKDMSIPDYLVFKQILENLQTMVAIDYNIAEIYSISIESSDEEFSKILCEAFYENLIDYYIERATRKAKITVDFLEEKLAYVKAQLENSEFNLADYKDKANNLVTFKADLNETRYLRNKALLEGLYSQTATALEMSKTNLQSIMPLFQTIDEPHLPLPVNEEPLWKKVVLYSIIILVIDLLILILIFARKNYWIGVKTLIKES